MKGRVSSFNPGKGFGFITPEDGSKDVFVHQSAIKIGTIWSLAVGQSVEFEVKVGSDGRAMAANVIEPGEVSVQSNSRGYRGRGHSVGGRGCGCGGRGGGGEEEAFSDKKSGGRGRGYGLGRRGGGGGTGRGGEGCYGGDGEEAFLEKEGTDGKPPADIEVLIRNYAALEGAFGREYTKQLYVKQEKGNSRVNFLLPGDKYHAYYQQCVSEVSANIKNDRKLKRLESKAGVSSSIAALFRKMKIVHEHQVDSDAINVRIRK